MGAEVVDEGWPKEKLGAVVVVCGWAVPNEECGPLKLKPVPVVDGAVVAMDGAVVVAPKEKGVVVEVAPGCAAPVCWGCPKPLKPPKVPVPAAVMVLGVVVAVG